MILTSNGPSPANYVEKVFSGIYIIGDIFNNVGQTDRPNEI